MANNSPQKIKDYETTITILEHISDSLFILDIKGVIQYANSSALEKLDAPYEEIYGLLIDDIITQENLVKRQGGAQNIFESFANGIYNDIEAQLSFKGVQIPILVSFKIVEDANQEPNYIIVTAKDLSIRRALQQELEEEQVVSISKDRIRALGELSVGLVHEISQPLAAMKMRLELMRDLDSSSRENSPLEKSFDDMDYLVDRMANTIQAIRHFAYQTEDNAQTAVDINNAVDNAVRLVSYEMAKKDIKLSVKKAEYLPTIMANQILIEQIFVNIMINARDAYDSQKNDGKKIKKHIQLSTILNHNKWIEIHIEDNAGGIDKAILDRIFHPFFTTKEKSKGTGLGLSMSKKIVGQLGGEIRVDVKENIGSTFIVMIPLEEIDERAQLFNLISMHHEEI